MPIILTAAPEGADPALAPWYQSLETPDTYMPCCSVADCRPTQERTNADHYEVFLDQKTFGPRAPNAWTPVPHEAILHGHSNPTGSAVVCFYRGAIRCFVPGTGT